MQQIRKAIIPAAGLGTRMLPISHAVCKEMLPIVDLFTPLEPSPFRTPDL